MASSHILNHATPHEEVRTIIANTYDFESANSVLAIESWQFIVVNVSIVKNLLINKLLKTKVIVLVVTGVTKGLNMRDSGLNRAYAAKAIIEKRASASMQPKTVLRMELIMMIPQTNLVDNSMANNALPLIRLFNHW